MPFFIAFGRGHGYVFGNVVVIPYIHLCSARKHREHECEHLKTRFSKIGPEPDALFGIFQTCSWLCVRNC